MATDFNITLRAAGADDLAWAVALMTALGLPTEGLDEQFGDGYVVAELGGEAIGLGGMEVYGDAGLLRSVGVTKAFQGTSIGRTIVEDRLGWARGRRLGAVFLLTETAPGFFERLGFKIVDRESFPPEVQASKEYSEVCPDTAVAMRLEL